MLHKTRVLVDAYNVLCARMIGEEPAVSIPLDSMTVFPQPGRPKDPEELKKVQHDYCKMRGYDPETGVPTREELEKLGMKDIADTLDSSMGEIPKKDAV